MTISGVYPDSPRDCQGILFIHEKSYYAYVLLDFQTFKYLNQKLFIPSY